MFKIALKSTMARKGRLLLTSLAVIAGCAFLSGVFVFSDTIRGSFDTLFANAYEKTDAFVRSANVIEGDFGAETRDRIPDALVTEVAAMPGVAEAVGDVSGFARVANAEGEVVGIDGPPKFGASLVESDSTPWRMAEGTFPSGPDQVVLDRLSADQGDIGIGDTVTVTAEAGAREFTVVGIVTFGDADTSGGANWALFDLPTAQDFVIGQPGLLDSITVVGDGSLDDQALADSIQAGLGGDDIEVLTGAEITDENQSAVEEGLSFFTIFLTIFAAISLFVGSFIIFNVFSISAAQRQKENALLRAIGASRSQVTRVLFVEALAVGIIGGLLGFIGGVLLAMIIMRVLEATGFGLSDASLVVQPSVLITSLIVGIVVTMVCAVVPAIRSGRVPPLAAMRDVSVDRSGVSRARLITGAAFLAIAIIGTLLGISGNAIWLGPGIVGLFVAMVVLGPLFAAPIARWLTKPLGALRGVTGEIAGRNAATSPKRTALTAGALGIGLALLIGVSTLGSSVKSSIRQTIGEQFTGDFAVSSNDDQGFGGLPTTLVDGLNELPEVEAAVGIGVNLLTITENGEPQGRTVLATEPSQAAVLFQLPFTEGGWAALDTSSILLSTKRASSMNVGLGGTVDVIFLDQTTASLVVAGLFDSEDFGSVIVDRKLFADQALPVFDVQILVRSAPGTSEAEAEAAIRTVTDDYPTSDVQTREQFIDDQSKQVDGFLNFIYVLLLMSVFIAILGIVITLLLSVYERRRELGLVRAVGMTRQQVRSSIRWEAVVTALLGAMMGTGLGLALGWIVVKALEDEGLNTFSVSVTTIIIFVVLAIAVAVIAAWIPALRAAKADILQAIATT